MAIPEALELVEAYRRKELSPVEATRAALEAIERLDPLVNAFVLVDADGALAAARRSEARWHLGEPLGIGDGVPTSIKDALLTRGWPTLRGSKLVDAEGPWEDDAPSVARLRESGAVILGKTTTPEFSWKGVTDSLRHGVTRNPWNLDKTSGGSSGGGAAAVGLGMGAWSVGTDAGGSVRIPAALTGTVAFKPTYGVVPLYPPSSFGTLSHVGPMARSVRDCAALLDVISGFDPRDWSAAPRPPESFLSGLDGGVAGLRIAFSSNLGFVRNEPDVDAAVRAAVDVFVDAGAEVDEVNPGFADQIEEFHTVWFAASAHVLATRAATGTELVDPGLLRTAAAGAAISAAEYLDATAARMELGTLMSRFHETYDVLLTPTLPLAAFPVGQDVPDAFCSRDWTRWTPYTYPFNMTQQPALSVPCGFTNDALPVGLQIVGPRHADARVLQIGHAYQMASDWHRMNPRLLAGAVDGIDVDGSKASPSRM